MKITLHTLPVNGRAFNCQPAREIELDAARIACNSVHLPGATNYHNTGLWIVGNEYGALGAVWASHEQEALDALMNENLGGGLLIDESDADEDSARLGNAGELVNLDHAWLQRVRLDWTQDTLLCAAFAEAIDSGRSTLAETPIPFPVMA